MDLLISTQDLSERKKHWYEIGNIWNEQGWIIWLPIREYKASDQQPLRQPPAEHHGAPDDLEYRQGLRQMKTRRLLAAALVVAVFGTAGCRRRAAEVVEYADPHPLPAEPPSFDAADAGPVRRPVCHRSDLEPEDLQRHDGERAHRHRTSPSGLFARLLDYDNIDAEEHSRPGEVVGDGARWPDVDVPPPRRAPRSRTDIRSPPRTCCSASRSPTTSRCIPRSRTC